MLRTEASYNVKKRDNISETVEDRVFIYADGCSTARIYPGFNAFYFANVFILFF